MSTTQHVGTVTLKTSCVPLLKSNLDRISVLFSAKLSENCASDPSNEDRNVTVYNVYSMVANTNRTVGSDFISRLQVRQNEKLGREFKCGFDPILWGNIIFRSLFESQV